MNIHREEYMAHADIEFSSSVQLDSSRVSLADEWDAELNTISEKLISTSNHVLICLSYKHNSPLLTRKVDNRLKMENALNHEYKNNNWRNFQFTKFSSNDFVLTDRRSLSGKRPKSVCGKSYIHPASF